MRRAALAALGAALLAPPAPAQEAAAEARARRIEARHRRSTDLVARFTQTYRSGMLGRELVETGTLSVKPPGRMLWQYEKPEKKTFVADGSTFYFYVPADRQVIVRQQAGEHGLPALLLSGRSDILREFAVTAELAPGGRERLRLVPRRDDPEVQVVFLEADEQDRIRGIEVVDTQGNRSRFRFDDVRENVGLKDALFRFKVPAGVEVVKG
ncbi:MAG TPA: outer membrane lipoprotein carrier protein LolA [Vicinamibacteria bacterium]|jgi:outer membrane lipoprotein carrier protein